MIRTIEKYPSHFFGKLTVEADEKIVRVTYRNLKGGYSKKFQYKDLRKETDHLEGNVGSWESVGFGVIMIGLFTILFVSPFHRGNVFFSFLVIGGLIYLLSFRKQRWVVFQEKSGNQAFVLNAQKSRQMIDFIKDKLIYCEVE